jgi:hypothetical protein
MGQELGAINARTQQEISTLEGQIKNLTSSKEWELAQAAVDAAGVVDPTPISDGVSAVMSLAKGDWWGAALSAVSMVPYLGDAVAKTAKGARAVQKLKELTDAIADATKRLDGLRSSSKAMDNRKEAARRVREERKHAANACKGCDAETKYGTQLPRTGKWEGERGNSKWTSDDGKYSVEYKDGYPDFSTAKGPPGNPIVKDSVEIPDMQGKNSADFSAANQAMRDKHGSDWRKPEGYTWHHKEDGVTMELVRTDVHNKADSGAAHTGGASIVNDQRF